MLSTKHVPVLIFIVLGFVNGARERLQQVVEVEGMPADVSDAIRGAKKQVKQALDAAKDQEKEKDKLKAEAEKTAAQKEAAEKASEEAAKQASAKTQEAAAQAKDKAAKAAKALETNKDWKDAVAAHQAAQDKLQAANDDYNAYNEHVAAEIKKLNDELAKKNQAKADAAAEVAEAARKAEAGKIAYDAAESDKDSSVKALTEATKAVQDANAVAAEKAAGAKVAGREAEEAQQAVEDAVAALNDAKEVVQAAKAKKTHLWDLYDKVEAFYKTTSKIVRAANDAEDDCGSKKMYQCIVEGELGEELKAVLKSHNDMIIQYRVIKELYDDAWQLVKDTISEVDTNARSQVLLACDPYKELGEADTKCYEDLWPQMDMNKAKIE